MYKIKNKNTRFPINKDDRELRDPALLNMPIITDDRRQWKIIFKIGKIEKTNEKRNTEFIITKHYR